MTLFNVPLPDSLEGLGGRPEFILGGGRCGTLEGLSEQGSSSRSTHIHTFLKNSQQETCVTILLAKYVK